MWVVPWVWDTSYEIMGLETPDSLSPFHWDSCCLLNDFLCTQEPGEAIVAESVLEFPPSHKKTMELCAMMQRSPVTAEGTD